MWNDVDQRIQRAMSGVRQAFRGVLTRADSASATQLVQADGLAGERLQDNELFQHYGFTSNPLPGTMAVVLPHGVLFRGSSEGTIRQYLIEKLNVIDAVIGLPANIFYGTSIPTCVLVLKKNRDRDDVLFIDASGNFEKQKTQNVLLPAHIDAIVDAYAGRENVAKFAHVASLADIRANDFNLNIPRYVDTFEAEAVIDLDAVARALAEIRVASGETEKRIGRFCAELGIVSPFGGAK